MQTDQQATNATQKGRSVRWAWRAAGIVAALAVLAFGALSAVGALARTTQRMHRVFPGLRSMEVSSSGGSISVVGVRETEPAVDAAVTSGPWRPGYSERLEGDRLVLRAQGCGMFTDVLCSVDFAIRVPPGIAVTAESGGGDVTVSDVGGDLTVTSSGGDVELGGARAERVFVHSDGGDVTGRALLGSTIDASSDGGDVTLSFAAPPERVAADSDGGRVAIKVPDSPDAYRVEASADGGDVTTRIRTDPGSRRVIRASSSGDDVTIRYTD